MQRKAVTANTTAKPLSPMVMGFELEAWLMRVLSQGHKSKQPQPRQTRFDRDQPSRPQRSTSTRTEPGNDIFAPGINDLANAIRPPREHCGLEALGLRLSL